MNKKIVIVGPPGAGKTTLRKIFFEGENSSQLLEYALDPTHGQESLILKLKNEIGIFDLAGQENQRWFETEEKSIFYNAKIILIVIDITSLIENTLNFIRNVIKIRNSYTPHSMIYVLLHKIDLISQTQLKKKKIRINRALYNEKLIKVLFSSVKKEYFATTFSYFLDILMTCLHDEDSFENFDFFLLNETIRLLELIDKELISSKKDLHDRLNITEEDLNRIIKNLIKTEQIQLSEINNNKSLSLTETGKNNFNKIVNNFSMNSILSFKSNAIVIDVPDEKTIPPFLGYFIANEDGLALQKVELCEGILLKYLKNRNLDKDLIENDKFDVDLIPMFVSALEKFSCEINIKNLSGFSLIGTNLKMEILGFDQYTVTLFSNPNVNIKNIKYKIENFFTNLFKIHEKEFKHAIKTSSFGDIQYLAEKGVNWLKRLNKLYESTIIKTKFFDRESAKSFYDDLDNFQKDVNIEYSLILEKIKKLKINLMNAILLEDFEEIEKLAIVARNLKSEFY
jgi:GTPase SAR1 family protein